MESKRVEDCFGHASFTRPEDFRPVYQFHEGDGDATLYFGRNADFKKVEVTVVAVDVDASQFVAAIDARAGEVSSRVHDVTDGSMLLARETDESHDWVVIRHYTRPSVIEAQTYELHRLVNGVHVALQTIAYDDADEGAVRSRLQSVATALATTASGNPASRALCLGALRVSAGQDYEVARMLYRGVGPTFGGVQLELEMDTLPSQEELGLVERGEANLAGLGVRPRVLRKGPRVLAGEKGSEWLGVFAADGYPLHSFYAETSTEALGKGVPRLQVELHAGEAKNDMDITASPLDDQQALELWDSIVGSFQSD